MTPGIVCKICSTTFSATFVLKRHIKEVHSEIFKCEKCPQTYNSKRALISHRKEHKIRCAHCNYSASSPCVLEYHVAARHGGVKRFQCNVEGCGKMFAKSSSASWHKHKVHGVSSEIVINPPTEEDKSSQLTSREIVMDDDLPVVIYEDVTADGEIIIKEDVVESDCKRETPQRKRVEITWKTETYSRMFSAFSEQELLTQTLDGSLKGMLTKTLDKEKTEAIIQSIIDDYFVQRLEIVYHFKTVLSRLRLGKLKYFQFKSDFKADSGEGTKHDNETLISNAEHKKDNFFVLPSANRRRAHT